MYDFQTKRYNFGNVWIPEYEIANRSPFPERKRTVKLDKKFEGTIIKVKDGSTVPDDQYVVFLAKDNAFAAALYDYRRHCIKLECDTEQLEAVNRLIANVQQWRNDNAELCKNPDAAGEKLLP